MKILVNRLSYYMRCFQNLELILGPRVKSNDCEVHLNVKGIGEITMSNFQFTGDMQVGY